MSVPAILPAGSCEEALSIAGQIMAQDAGDNGAQQAPAATVPPPPNGLASNSNYALYDDCKDLVGLSATIDVTEDIVLQSATGPTMGLNFQLNAYADQAKSAWQQYVVGLIGSELHGKINNWKYMGPGSGKPLKPLCNYSFNMMSLPSNYIIPAGYQIAISLLSDEHNKINGMTVQIIDRKGVANVSATKMLHEIGMTGEDMAPITSFHLVLVGPAHRNHATFSSGAGSFTYSAPSGLIVLSELPTCVIHPNGTAESSNSVYGPLAAGPGPSPSITQSFGVALQAK
jgi:hypothetical protein